MLAVPERIKPVCADRVKVEVGISDRLLEKIKRVQDLEAQRTKQNVNLEQTLESLVEDYLDKHDPLIKAHRKTLKTEAKLHVVRQKQLCQKSGSQKVLNTKSSMSSEGAKRYIPAELKHKVAMRDKGQCGYIHKNGNRCENKRWLEVLIFIHSI